MAVTSFVPEVWAASVLTALGEALTYGSDGVTNRDYQGEITEFGGAVTVNTLADPTIETYVPYTDMAGSTASTAPQTMAVDQRKAWQVPVDDVDKAQMRDEGAFISALSARAAHKLSATADAYVAGLMADAVTPASATLGTSTSAYDVLLDLRTALSNNDVPVQGRWAVVTPAMAADLLADQRFVASGDAAGAQTRSTGVIGSAAGFAVLESPYAPAGATTGKLIIAGHPAATTFAEQISKMETVRHPRQFVDLIRGLHLYGAKVVRPEALAAVDVVGA